MSRRLILRAGLRAAGVALAVSAPLTAFADKGRSCSETCVPSTLVQKSSCADTACTSGSSCTATAIPNCTNSNGTAPAGNAAAPANTSGSAGLFQFVAEPSADQPPAATTGEPTFQPIIGPATPPVAQQAAQPAFEPAVSQTFEPVIQPAGPQTAEFSAGESADPSAGQSADQFGIEQATGFTLPTKADEADTRAHRIASREGTGFRGFCPVVLRDQQDLADAQTEIFSIYESRTYRFSSAEAKAQFDADPAKYAPIRGGTDIVLLAEEGTEQEGTLAHAHWFRDRLFFFTSESTAVRFFNDPTKYVSE